MVTLLAAMSSALLVAACGPSAANGPPSTVATSASSTPPGTSASSNSGTPSTGSAGSASGSTASMPSATPGGSAVPASQLDTTGVVGGGPNGVWTQNGGRTIVLAVEQAGCEQSSATVASQTASQVVVQLVTTTQAKPGRVCPMIVRQVVLTATLSAPLGTRQLVLKGSLTHS
jgi:hypothetical protein